MAGRRLVPLLIYEKRSWFAEAGIMGGLERAFAGLGIRACSFDRTGLLSLLADRKGEFFRLFADFLKERGIDFVLACNLNGSFVVENGSGPTLFYDRLPLWNVSYIADLLDPFLEPGPSVRARTFTTLLASPHTCFATVRRGDAEKLTGLRTRAFHLPLAFDNSLGVQRPRRRDLDVVYVGPVRGEGEWRQQVLLSVAPLNLHLFGPEGQPAVLHSALRDRYRGRLPGTPDLYRTYARTRICLDLNAEGGVLPDRLFQAMGSGCLAVTRRKEETLRHFEPNKHLVTYDDHDEIPSLISYYLEHRAAAEKIADRGRERVLDGHTYRNRVKVLLQNFDAFHPAGGNA